MRGIGAPVRAIAAFAVAWERPNEFRKVLSNVGSFVNIQGGYIYPERVRRPRRSPIGFSCATDGTTSRLRSTGEYDEKRDWFYQNVRLMKALRKSGYDVSYSWGMNRTARSSRRNHA